MNDKKVTRRSWEHSTYNGYDITKTEVDVTIFTDGFCTGGSIRYEWTATNGKDVVEAKTLKELKKRIDTL